MDTIVDQARAASACHDTTTATQLWLEASCLPTMDASLTREVASALQRAGLFEEVDKVLQTGIVNHPANLEIFFEFARAGGRLDFPEEVRRWSLLRENFPKQIHGYLGETRIYRRVGDIDAAEAVIATGFAQIGPDVRLLGEYAACAAAREDWQLTLDRLETAVRSPRATSDLFSRIADVLIRLDRPHEAESWLKQGAQKWPNNMQIQAALAGVATSLEKWDDALQIWTDILRNNVEDAGAISGYGQALWRRNLKTAATDTGTDLAAPVEVGFVNDATTKELLMLFESLGQNCEFGLVQRRFGAEPLGLLRWTTTIPQVLAKGLRSSFQGVGDLENTILDFRKHEIMVNDLSNNIRFHTFMQKTAALDQEKVRFEQARHLTYLRKIFLERLEDDDKIYVYKADQGVTIEEVDEIYKELQKFGPKRLLIVTRSSELEPPASVTRVRENLYRGYIERFGLDRGKSWDIDFTGWANLCRAFAGSVVAAPEQTGL